MITVYVTRQSFLDITDKDLATKQGDLIADQSTVIDTKRITSDLLIGSLSFYNNRVIPGNYGLKSIACSEKPHSNTVKLEDDVA